MIFPFFPFTLWCCCIVLYCITVVLTMYYYFIIIVTSYLLVMMNSSWYRSRHLYRSNSVWLTSYCSTLNEVLSATSLWIVNSMHFYDNCAHCNECFFYSNQLYMITMSDCQPRIPLPEYVHSYTAHKELLAASLSFFVIFLKYIQDIAQNVPRPLTYRTSAWTCKQELRCPIGVFISD